VVIPHTDETASNAYKYLAAGGMAGAVSRTCTAPFDRLKVYLITQTSLSSSETSIVAGLKSIYRQGGLRGFFVGNGLNIIKIVPESAIKFYVFETAKSVLAELTQSEDKNAIPVGARFIAGGVAGLCAQFCIYPVETLKTRIMSSAGANIMDREKYVIYNTAKSLYKAKGLKGFWPGLAVSLMGVFPYQALDMGIYETMKVTYLQYVNSIKDENGKGQTPNVMILWACGMVSGSIGATTVYPLNMIRTR
jgi:solute carrier family 25 phosphate transporter 23/24/25/41